MSEPLPSSVEEPAGLVLELRAANAGLREVIAAQEAAAHGDVADIDRNGNEGIGKPEPLRHAFGGYWSRRITDEHRLVYRVVEDEIRIAACRYHYGR